MADLLECLIQIKALGEALAGSSCDSAGESADGELARVWERMADAERRYANALGTRLAGGPPPARSQEGAAAASVVFASLRRANLEMLDRCTAAQLSGLVDWPGRPSTTVADLVAIMLAHDTALLAVLRQRGSKR
jgi:hypothetical protein